MPECPSAHDCFLETSICPSAQLPKGVFLFFWKRGSARVPKCSRLLFWKLAFARVPNCPRVFFFFLEKRKCPSARVPKAAFLETSICPSAQLPKGVFLFYRNEHLPECPGRPSARSLNPSPIISHYSYH